ncbi:AMSH-like ubiquitin thioesterase 2 [Vitis vinifera]|uniref:AMSH-like ubiquitin thioesterase 2 n=1 Tax=Vitis vinifera TaxID=29760 RepID=A0A438JNE6_VITVI|nr:AMSH-like ubiquitin thioesterase 2 [Vitis vinifera]
MPYYRFRIINEEKDELASVCSVDSSTSCSPFESAWPTSFMTASEHCITVHAVTKASPSPIIYCTETAHHDKHISHIKVSDSEPGHSKSCSETAVSKKLQDVHISARLMEDFLELARDNTKNDVETCGILGAFLVRFMLILILIPYRIKLLDGILLDTSNIWCSLPSIVNASQIWPAPFHVSDDVPSLPHETIPVKMGTFYVTTLIIPKQESTSNSCQAIKEEEIFAIQNEQSLFPVGWIHVCIPIFSFKSLLSTHAIPKSGGT